MSDSRLENNIKKEKKKNNEIKRKANDKKEKNNVNDITKEKQETVNILEDSMVKKLNGYLLTKKVRHKFLVKVRPFSGAKVSCMVDQVKPTYVMINQIILYYILEQMIYEVKKRLVTLQNQLLI